MKLYKYAGPERIDVISNLELRFTQPGALGSAEGEIDGVAMEEIN